MSKHQDRYLGDGVYASFDGFGITLDLRGQDSTTRIYLDPEVVCELHLYADEVYAAEKADQVYDQKEAGDE